MTVDTLPTERKNGKAHHQSNGRAVPALPVYTFKDSERTVYIRQRVSPYLGDKLKARYEKDHPEPTPPMLRIPNDDQGGFIEEADHNDEAYQKRAKRWYSEYQRWAFAETVDYILQVCIDPGEIDQVAVDAHKRYAGNDENEPDELIYLKYICLGSQDDAGELVKYLTQRSQPTQEQINEKVDAFRGQVPE